MSALHAVILADGDCPTRAALDAAWPDWADDVALVVAADGAVRHAGPLGLRVDRWVGDGDSTSADQLAALAAAGVAVERAPVDKDESDTELALLDAVARGAGRVTILGGLGGPRTDHALANLALLQHPALANRAGVLYDAACARLSLLAAPDRDGRPVTRELAGRVGDIVSLLPVGEPAHGVETDALRYPLRRDTLPAGPARGLSNVREAAVARVTLLSGRLLVIETPASLRP